MYSHEASVKALRSVVQDLDALTGAQTFISGVELRGDGDDQIVLVCSKGLGTETMIKVKSGHS